MNVHPDRPTETAALIQAVLRDLLDACAQVRRATDALAASRAATTVAIARLDDVERLTNDLLAAIAVPVPTPLGEPS